MEAMDLNFEYYRDIYWCDLVIEGAIKEDLILARTLSAIYRLREDSGGRDWLPNSRTIIGLDLITLGSFPITRSLDDLASAVQEWPFFAFNYTGEITAYDNFNNLIKELERINEIIPVIHGFLPFDINEHGNDLSNGIRSVLSGNEVSCRFDGSADVELAAIDSWPFLKPKIQIKEGNYIDTVKITWLGVRNKIISDWLTSIFNMSPREINFEEINDLETDHSTRSAIKEYVESSKLFQYNNKENKFILKFNRKEILPKVRSNGIKEFIDNIERTQATGIGTQGNNPKRKYWYYHFDKFFNTANTVYLDKLKNMIASIISSYEFDKICLIENGQNEIFNSFVEKAISEWYGATPEIVRSVRSRRPRLFPYEKINKNERVILITDLINTGSAIDSSIAIIKHYKGIVSSIFCLVLNDEKVTSPAFYIYKGEKIPIWYFIKRELLPIGLRDSAKREEMSRLSEDVRAIHDYSFFWELMQAGGDIHRQHYIAFHKTLKKNYESHFDVMFDFSNLKNIPELLQDFISQLDLWRKDRKFEVIISNTSLFAPDLAKIIKDFFVNTSDLYQINFKRDKLDFAGIKGKSVLIVDDGINSYGSLARLVKYFSEELNYSKHEIGICALVERQCKPSEESIILNKSYVHKNADLYVYYKTAVPFFVIDNDIQKIRNCPICYLNNFYEMINGYLKEYSYENDFGDIILKSLPRETPAPVRIR
jgi:hypoxanthine-guanine phosphoribosyltransferase